MKCIRKVSLGMVQAWFLLIIFVFISPFLSWADINEWSLVGLANEQIGSLIIHPENPDIIIAASESPGGIFRTINGGVTWDTVALHRRTVQNLKESPNESRTLYAAAWDGMYRSYDYGISWVHVTGFGTPPSISCTCFDIAVDPLDSLRLYICTCGPAYGLLGFSNNYGENWNRMDWGCYHIINYHYFIPTTWFTAKWGILLMSQNCSRWNEIFNTEYGIFDVEPSNHSSRIWLATNGLAWSDDLGASWEMTIQSPITYIFDIIQNVSSDSVIAIGTTAGVYLIDDVWGEWEHLDNGAPTSGCYLVGYCDETQTLYACFVNGLWEYTFEGGYVQSSTSSLRLAANVYPNPFKDEFEIVLPQGEWEVSLYNILGQRIARRNISSIYRLKSSPWKLGELASGTYFILAQPEGTNTQLLPFVKTIHKLR